MARDWAWRVTLVLAGLLVPSLGYLLQRRPAVAAVSMVAAICLAFLALKIVPSPLGSAVTWPVGIAYAGLLLSTALHAASQPPKC